MSAPEEPAAWLREGARAHEGGDLEAADALYRKVLARDPRNVHALFLLGTIHVHRQDLEGARRFLSEAVAADPRHGPAHLQLGHVAWGQGRLPDAVDCYRKAVAADPESAAANAVLGHALQAVGDLAGAEAACARAIALDPAGPAGHLALGRVLRAQERYAEAETYCRRALALTDGAPEAARELGIVLAKAERFDDAYPHLQAALAANPGDLEARGFLGDVHRSRGRLGEAIECYAAVLAARPDVREAHLKYGLVLKEMPTGGRGALLARLREDHVYADPAESLAIARGLAEGLPYPHAGALKALAAFLDGFDPGEVRPAAWWEAALARFGPREAGHDKVLRAVWAAVYAWSLPSREALEAVADWAGGARLASYGAGSGYWEYLLKGHLGVDVRASDLHLQHRFLPMETADFAQARPDPEEVVMLAWIDNRPPVAAAAKTLLGRLVPGQRLVLVGEPPDASGRARTCGTTALFRGLARDFRVEAEVRLVGFAYLDERLVLLRREGAPSEAG